MNNLEFADKLLRLLCETGKKADKKAGRKKPLATSIPKPGVSRKYG